MNGIDLLARNSRARPPVHVILLTSYDEFCYAKQGLQYAANDYLLKSEISPETLPGRWNLLPRSHEKKLSYSFPEANVIGELFHSGRLSIPSSTQRIKPLRAFVESNYHIILGCLPP